MAALPRSASWSGIAGGALPEAAAAPEDTQERARAALRARAHAALISHTPADDDSMCSLTSFGELSVAEDGATPAVPPALGGGVDGDFGEDGDDDCEDIAGGSGEKAHNGSGRDAEPLHRRFIRRLATEVDAALRRASEASGAARFAALDDLYLNLVSPLEPRVRTQLLESGYPAPVPRLYYELLAQTYASAEASTLLLRAAHSWRALSTHELFPPVFCLLFYLWFLGAYEDVRLADSHAVWHSPSPARGPDGTPAASSPVLRSLRTDDAMGSTGASPAHDLDASAPVLAASADVDAADPTAHLRTGESLFVLITGASRAFWADAQTGRSDFGQLFRFLWRTSAHPSRLQSVPASMRGELAAVLARYALHYRTGVSLRGLLRGLRDLDLVGDGDASAGPGAVRAGSLDLSWADAASPGPPSTADTDALSGRGSANEAGEGWAPGGRLFPRAASRTGSLRRSSAGAIDREDGDEGLEEGGDADGADDATADEATADGEMVTLGLGQGDDLGDQGGIFALAASMLPFPAAKPSETEAGTAAGALDAAEVGAGTPTAVALAGGAEALAYRADVFVDEIIVHLRSLREEAPLLHVMEGLRGLQGVPLPRPAANRLHAMLHQFCHPGGPRFPTRRVRRAAEVTVAVLFPHGRWLRRGIGLAFRLLHPVRACLSLAVWGSRTAGGIWSATGGRVLSCCRRTPCGRFVVAGEALVLATGVAAGEWCWDHVPGVKEVVIWASAELASS